LKKSLVVVESPAKAKTINKFLGKDYVVKASVGHIRDLPKTKLGIDLKGGSFEPEYVLLRNKGKILEEMRQSARDCETVLLAPDPDREGEAIAWHIAHELRAANPNVSRILFYEITRGAIRQAVAHPRQIDRNKVNAQQARRVMDRLMGYKISPFLWDKLRRRNLSAGRVQSVALRLICDREREVRAFVAEEYWTVAARLSGSKAPEFQAALALIDGQKADLPNADAARRVVEELRGQRYVLERIERRERRQRPKAPFITSTLQQEASSRLRLPPSRTMRIAQDLYEGVALGQEGPVGLITYMRTDSTRISQESIDETRAYLVDRFGAEYVPEVPHVFASRKQAQDAHEAIRPTSVRRTPESVKEDLSRDQFRLYKLIWERFVASQMAEARLDVTRFEVSAGRFGLRATGSILTFEGHLRLYQASPEEEAERRAEASEAVEGSEAAPAAAAAADRSHAPEEPGELEADSRKAALPELIEGEQLRLVELTPAQHFTQPPPRFTEASLIRELERRGIGRPSTYATIITKIEHRDYTSRVEGRFMPTELGFVVTDLLVEHFADILDVGFTAQLEEKLDAIEEGRADWLGLVRDFYQSFSRDLERAGSLARRVEGGLAETNIPCEKCGTLMVVKIGRNGEFLACPRYPECSGTRNFRRDAQGNIVLEQPAELGGECPRCGRPLATKSARGARFIGCSGYPECRYTAPFTIGVPCPEPGCGGELAEKRTQKGRFFYGCTRYPECRFTSWQKPYPEPCPRCGHPFLVEKVLKTRGLVRRCPKKECGHEVEATQDVAALAVED
jgi:DNA topoisomerase-1